MTAKYDAAQVLLGGDCRMPTSDEMKELVDKCQWELTTLNGVKGYKVTGSYGKNIFLPLSGVGAFSPYSGTTEINGEGQWGNYISSTPDGNPDGEINKYYDSVYYIRVDNHTHYHGSNARSYYNNPLVELD